MFQQNRPSPASFWLASLLFLALLALGMSLPRRNVVAAPMQPTPPATPAYCQGTYSADTRTAENTISSYACRPDWPETGPEHFYRLKTSFTQALTLTLSYTDTYDLDLFLLSEDDPGFCYAADASMIVEQLPPGDHLIVVDGYAGSSGSYVLNVDCVQQPWATATPTATPAPTATSTPTVPPSPTVTPTATPTRVRLNYNNYLPRQNQRYPPPTPEPQQLVIQARPENPDAVFDSYLSAWDITQNYGKLDRLLLRQPDIMAPLLSFDLSAVPPNAHLVQATLSLYALSQSNDNPAVVGVYRINRAWSETEVSWQMATATQPWQQAGANAIPDDREALPRSQQIVQDIQRFYNWDVTALVQEWLYDPQSQHGLILKAFDEARVQYAFASSQYVNPLARPQLTLTYWMSSSPTAARESDLP